MGNTFDQTLEWQLEMRIDNPWQAQEHGDVICYERVGCDSGVLCLDWREICDAIQQCMFGVDEEHCDLLEMNQCNDDDEYRCMNGMCIPDAYFLDGEFDCLDWSDELKFKNDEDCPKERVSSECDDRVCPPDQWSCGDGQCTSDRLAFQKLAAYVVCDSRWDQYFMCETHATSMLWTMSNGRCYGGGRYDASSMVHDNEELCEYLLKCVLSLGVEKRCSCHQDWLCTDHLARDCPQPLIRYPRGALIAPYMFLVYNVTEGLSVLLPNFIVINGTVRCRDSLINASLTIGFNKTLNARGLTEDLFCAFSRDRSSAEIVESRNRCHRANESMYVAKSSERWMEQLPEQKR